MLPLPTTAPVALITGASKGLGLAIANAMAAQGYSLGLVGRQLATLDPLVQTLAAQYPQQQFTALVADLSQPQASCGPLVAQAMTQLGHINVLVNNAGVAGRISLLTEMDDADIANTLQTNLLAPVLLTRHVLPHMVQQGGGTVVNISSVAGKTAFPYWSVYVASKFGLSALTEAVGEEQRSNGIRVVAIHPGAVDTPIWDGIDANAQRANMLQPETIANAVLFALNQPDGAWVSDITVKPLRSVM
jgi:NADP-dependent 3-hydroxy acid dehydrogenase YdfG